jgi:hypothetical protein
VESIRVAQLGRLAQTQRQEVPALKAAIEDLKADRLQGWEKLERHGVIREVIEPLREKKRSCAPEGLTDN